MSWASAAGPPKSICSSPRAGPTSSPPATLPFRSRSAASSACPTARPRRRSASLPSHGALTAVPRQSSPGITDTSCRYDPWRAGRLLSLRTGQVLLVWADERPLPERTLQLGRARGVKLAPDGGNAVSGGEGLHRL